MVVLVARGSQGLSDASGHSKVRGSGDGGDEKGGGVHETVSVAGALRRDEEENREDSHNDKHAPEVGVAILSGLNGVL